ncbi:hypothetical protein PNEG_02083 [Pneumocystis murina B123]|uniref:Golgi SNAP receptor complex member 1 n=1 Tax=Pneumocystis murina (strain B123) TaxID=1069680 RepID=M7PGB6_PNEMU|nr:hypothetical protein PNEG_02083 [Pneumocystis murina B123]EMR09494.1 hypothetical protein PNEG_02083 [Pneumocystis murina B123]
MLNETKSWSTLRLQLISLESQTESLLLELVTSSETLEEHAQDLFNKRNVIINSLSSLLDPDYGGDTIKRYHVERHIEILEKHKEEYEKMNVSLEIDYYFFHSFRKRENQIIKKLIILKIILKNNESDYFLEESNRIDNSHNMTDEILLQAYTTRDDFYHQKDMLHDMNQRMLRATNFISGIKYFISKINTKRKKNNLILSFVISACIIMTYFMI